MNVIDNSSAYLFILSPKQVEFQFDIFFLKSVTTKIFLKYFQLVSRNFDQLLSTLQCNFISNNYYWIFQCIIRVEMKKTSSFRNIKDKLNNIGKYLGIKSIIPYILLHIYT